MIVQIDKSEKEVFEFCLNLLDRKATFSTNEKDEKCLFMEMVDLPLEVLFNLVRMAEAQIKLKEFLNR
jgi:hypothetical protein